MTIDSSAVIRNRSVHWFVLLLLTSVLCKAASTGEAPKGDDTVLVPLIERMPNVPQPFQIIDWKARARGFDALVFDANASGDNLPLYHSITKTVNIDPPGFSFPAYVGEPGANESQGIATLAAVLGGTLVGCDEGDRVRMCGEWFNRKERLALNGPQGRSSGSFWYDLLPGILFAQLAERYPKVDGFEQKLIALADRWSEACENLGGEHADFNFTSYDFVKREGRFNGKWREPDAAAGVAYIEYAAWGRSHDPRHLEAARWCLDFLDRRKLEEGNPLYEILLYYAPALAARMNAEQGTHYDVNKLMSWCFSENRLKGGARIGWGIIAQRFGGYDCHGLQGSTTDRGGYAFAMNTFQAAGAIAPLARYDARYANAIGKWLLNVSNNARLFYGDTLPAGLQSCPTWRSNPPNVIPYEGLRKSSNTDASKSPYASGDPLTYGWNAKTDFCIYGGAHVGYLAALIEPTNQAYIQQIDLLATDFFHAPAYPTYLYYNPEARPYHVRISLPETPHDLYDAGSHTYIARTVTLNFELPLPEKSARVLVIIPSGMDTQTSGALRTVNGRIIDFHAL